MSGRCGSRVQGRAIVALIGLTAAGFSLAGCTLHGGNGAQAPPSVVAARRGDVVVSVGGVGRITEARAAGQISVPAAAAPGMTGGASAPGGSATSSSTGTPTASGGGGTASADAVFPHVTGRVATLLVKPGQEVHPGQPLARLDDGGTAAGAVLQARLDLATARVELQQKRTSDPLLGIPATPQELAAGRFAVASARLKLAQVFGPPRPADVSAARNDLGRAEADLAALLGRPADRARAINVAKQAVDTAQQKLDALLSPPNPADVAAAELDVKRAEADLADLTRQNPPAPVEQVAAAQKAVEAARLKLARVLAPPPAADVSAARLELARAQDDLQRLQEGPTPAAIASARQAVVAARTKLVQLLGQPLRADVASGRLDIRKAVADLAVLRRRGGPASAFDVELARLKVEAARAKLALAEFEVRQLTVRAAAGGTVTGILTVRGAPVDASTPIATVAALRSLRVSVQLSEFDVARVRAKLRAIVNVDALGGRAFPGKVLFVGLTGTDNGGVVTFPVQVGLANVTGLRPGMNVSVHVIIARRRRVVQVPLDAVSRSGGRASVTVVTSSGRTTTRRVKLGISNNKDVEIRRGLRAGERVRIGGGQGA